MTNLRVMSRNFIITALASFGMLATWFAMMSTSSCGTFFMYQPKMPTTLIKRDDE